MHLKRYFLLYTLVLLTIFLIAGSYYRFMVAHDYLVYYEGECDPYTEQCFLYCEDEECSEPSYYTEVVRKAYAVMSLCGEDITECESASFCGESEADCEVTYCDSSIEENECEDLGAGDIPAEVTEEEEVIDSDEEITNPEP